jgi:hypothetical protein
MTILADLLPKLATTEDDEQQIELSNLKRADAFAPSLIIGGPLLNAELAGDPTKVRLMQAIDRLSVTCPPNEDDHGSAEVVDDLVSRERWAYRLGLVTGLRLAQAFWDADPEALLAEMSPAPGFGSPLPVTESR